MAPETRAPLSATSVAVSPVLTPARLLRTTTDEGAVHVRGSGLLSDQIDSTQLLAGAVAVGVVCDRPAPSAALVTEPIGPVAAVPEYASSCSVALAATLSVTVSGVPASPAAATRWNTWVVGA